MVVTDLHGDYPAYIRYRDRFLNLHARGKADVLVFSGDLIHATINQTEPDRSLEIILDILRLRDELGPALIYLLGNHEMGHIYSTPLSRGKHNYSIPFEHEMGEHREQIIALFDSLPVYVRTAGGVALSHAGAAKALGMPRNMLSVLQLSHDELLQHGTETLNRAGRRRLQDEMARQMDAKSYDLLTRQYLAVNGPSDPRYDHFVRGQVIAETIKEYNLLHAAVFTRNEHTYGSTAYPDILIRFLQALSQGYHPQRLLVSGHVPTKGGYTLVHRYQLRLSSRAHAGPPDAGQYLLFDAAAPFKDSKTLSRGLRPMFEQ